MSALTIKGMTEVEVMINGMIPHLPLQAGQLLGDVDFLMAKLSD